MNCSDEMPERQGQLIDHAIICGLSPQEAYDWMRSELKPKSKSEPADATLLLFSALDETAVQR